MIATIDQALNLVSYKWPDDEGQLHESVDNPLLIDASIKNAKKYAKPNSDEDINTRLARLALLPYKIIEDYQTEAYNGISSALSKVLKESFHFLKLFTQAAFEIVRVGFEVLGFVARNVVKVAVRSFWIALTAVRDASRAGKIETLLESLAAAPESGGMSLMVGIAEVGGSMILTYGLEQLAKAYLRNAALHFKEHPREALSTFERAASYAMPGTFHSTQRTLNASHIKQFNGTESEAAAYAVARFQKLGWSKDQAIGMVSALEAESGLNPGIRPKYNESAFGTQHVYINDQDGSIAFTPRPGYTKYASSAYGIGQWLYGRQQDFAKWSGHSIIGSTLGEQIDFVDHELRTTMASAGSRIRATTTAYAASAAFTQYYEIPGSSMSSEIAKHAQFISSVERSSTNSALASNTPDIGVDAGYQPQPESKPVAREKTVATGAPYTNTADDSSIVVVHGVMVKINGA